MQIDSINEQQWFKFFEFCENEFFKTEVRYEYQQWCNAQNLDEKKSKKE